MRLYCHRSTEESSATSVINVLIRFSRKNPWKIDEFYISSSSNHWHIIVKFPSRFDCAFGASAWSDSNKATVSQDWLSDFLVFLLFASSTIAKMSIYHALNSIRQNAIYNNAIFVCLKVYCLNAFVFASAYMHIWYFCIIFSTIFFPCKSNLIKYTYE